MQKLRRKFTLFIKDFYKGCPVVTENAYGSGRAYYLSAESDQRFLSAFYKDVFIKAGLLKKHHVYATAY